MRLFKITDLKWITMLVIVCMMFSWHAMAKDVLTVRVGDYPPAYYKNSIGEWVGIEIDVLKAVFKEAQIQYQFLEMPWSPAVERIKTGELDVMLAISLTEERKSFIDYIGPSRYEQMVLIVRKDDMDLNVATLDDLAKLPINVGIQTDTEYPRLSERLKADPAFKSHFDYVTDQNFNLKRLSAKRIAGFLKTGILRFMRSGHVLNTGNSPSINSRFPSRGRFTLPSA
jgi:ABC-type amino acid transport substrate-binding protein